MSRWIEPFQPSYLDGVSLDLCGPSCEEFLYCCIRDHVLNGSNYTEVALSDL